MGNGVSWVDVDRRTWNLFAYVFSARSLAELEYREGNIERLGREGIETSGSHCYFSL